MTSGKHTKNCKHKLRKLRKTLKTYSRLNFTSNSLCSTIPSLHVVNDYADSGATNTYFRLRDVHSHKIKSNNPVNVQHTGRNYMISSYITTLDLPMIGKTNIIAPILP